MSGAGPMDVCRVKFVVDGNIDKVFDSIVDTRVRTKGTIEAKTVGESSEDYDQRYFAVKMPFPLKNRDFVLENYHRKRRDGSMMTLSRSIENDEVKSLKESSQKRRVRGIIHCGGYLLTPRVDEFSGKEQVEIIHVAAVDLNGVFGLDLLYRIAAVERIKGVVDSNVNRFTRGIVEEDEDVERGRGSSIFNVFSGVKQRMMGGGGGGKKKELIEADVGIELTDVYPQNDGRVGQTANPFRSKLQQYGVGNRAAAAAPTMPSTSFRGVPPPVPTSFSSSLPSTDDGF